MGAARHQWWGPGYDGFGNVNPQAGSNTIGEYNDGCGSFTGNWGVWNYLYFALIKGVTYNGVFYQGVDWLSWVLLFHIPVCCLPCSWVCFRQYLKLKHDAAK